MQKSKLQVKNQKSRNTSDGGPERRTSAELSRMPRRDSSEVDGGKKEEIIRKLKRVVDPELGINIVDLGLVYDIKNDKGNVIVLMTLTTPGCPMMGMFDQEVERAVKSIKGVKKVKVDLTFDPPWTPEKMSKEARDKLKLT